MKKLLIFFSAMALFLLPQGGFAQPIHPQGGFQIETAVSVTHITPENSDAYVNIGPLVGFRYRLPVTASGNNLLMFGAGAGIYLPVTKKDLPEKDFYVKAGFETGWEPVRITPFISFSFLSQDVVFYNSLGLELRFPISKILSIMLGGRTDFGHTRKKDHPLRPDYNIFTGITLNLNSQSR